MDTATIGYILLAGGALLLFQKRKVLGNKTLDMVLSVGLVLFGLSMTGLLSGLSTGSDQTVASAGIAGVTLYDGVSNISTTIDFYTNGDDTVTFYVADAGSEDNNWVNVTVDVSRKSAGAGESFTLECSSADFTKSGTVYNIVSRDTSGKLEGYVDGSGSTTASGWSESIGFTEGDVKNTYKVQFKIDEAAEDALTTKESVNIPCTVGNFPFNIIVVADD